MENLLRHLLTMTKRIIQFGTSRFLETHAALFISNIGESGYAIPVTDEIETPEEAELLCFRR